MKSELYSLTPDSLVQFLQECNIPKFRAQQIISWAWSGKVGSFSDMNNIPKNLRQLLSENLTFFTSSIEEIQYSQDGTRKYLIRLQDGNFIEAVGMPSFTQDGSISRLSVCFSTQVGCPMACSFCATGYEGFTRNLSVAEIVEQVVHVSCDFKHQASSLVAMGQGEGFLNYNTLLQALDILNAPWSYNIGARHITISTCGIDSGINKLSQDPHQYTLAISLHSAIQETRDALMPKVSQIPLPLLKETLLNYVEKTNRRISFEYLLIKGINDNAEHLEALTRYCKGLLCHVNLLLFNDIDSSPFKPSDKNTLKLWLKTLEEHHIPASLRNSRGSDIDGACGQLKNSRLNVT